MERRITLLLLLLPLFTHAQQDSTAWKQIRLNQVCMARAGYHLDRAEQDYFIGLAFEAVGALFTGIIAATAAGSKPVPYALYAGSVGLMGVGLGFHLSAIHKIGNAGRALLSNGHGITEDEANRPDKQK